MAYRPPPVGGHECRQDLGGCAALPPSRKAKALKAWWLAARARLRSLKPGTRVRHTWCTRMCRRVYASVLEGPRGGALQFLSTSWGSRTCVPSTVAFGPASSHRAPPHSGSAGGKLRAVCVQFPGGPGRGAVRPRRTGVPQARPASEAGEKASPPRSPFRKGGLLPFRVVSFLSIF